MKTVDSCLVAIDMSHGKDQTVLTIGQKRPGKDIDIVNVIQGEKALKLWNELLGKDKKEEVE